MTLNTAPHNSKPTQPWGLQLWEALSKYTNLWKTTAATSPEPGLVVRARTLRREGAKGTTSD